MSLPARALTLAGAVVALAAAPAGAATNGPIAFERGGGIISVPSAGGAETVLSPPGVDYEPAYSPDGRRIAFVVNRDVYVADADGSNRRPVTTDGLFNAGPSWSPDGKRIAYSGTGAGGRPDIFTIAAAGGQRKAVTTTGTLEEREPAWSPDGSRIAFNRLGAIWVADTSGADEVNLTPESAVAGCEDQPGYYFDGASREPAWSPDGERIAFSGPLDCAVSTNGKDIWTMDADGRNKRNLTRDHATTDAEPVFSPDGERIAFTRNVGSEVFVFTMEATGEDVRQVSQGGNDSDPSWGVAAQLGTGPSCIVPRLKGKSRAGARKALVRAGCALGKVKGPKGGRVRAQAKEPGAKLEAGSRVGVTLRKR